MLYTVALAACRVEASYPAEVPTGGYRLAVHLPNQQVTEDEAEEVTEHLAADGHPIVLLATQRGFEPLVVGLV